MISKKIKKNQTYKQASKRFDHITNQIKPLWQRYQLHLVGMLAGLFLLSIITAQFITADEPTQTAPVQPLQVTTLQLADKNSYQQLQAHIENESSTTLVAQTAGPVQKIYPQLGAYVKAGAPIIYQASSYAGGNQATVARQIAQKNLETADISLSNTSELVAQNRQLADLNRDNTQMLAEISGQSLGEMENLIDLIEIQVEELENQIYQAPDPQTQQTLRGQLIGLQANLNQVKAGYRTQRYTSDENRTPTQLSEISRDLVYTQTELQLQTARISREIAALNLQAARISESLSKVSAPYAGTIEAILVNVGDYVNPGTPVARISSKQPVFTLQTNVSGESARLMHGADHLILIINQTEHRISLDHVSSVPVSGGLYRLRATLPAILHDQVFDGQAVTIRVPVLVDSAPTTQPVILVPVSSVYITSTERFVYINQESQAISRTVETGKIVGNNIEILSGLAGNEELILSRNVTEGQMVATNED